jgi:hypothetical protein
VRGPAARDEASRGLRVVPSGTQRVSYRETYLSIMTSFGKEVKCQSLLNSTCTTTPLFCIVLSDIRLDQARDLPPFVIPIVSVVSYSDVPHFTMFTRINHTSHVRNRDTSLGNVCSCRQLRVGHSDLQMTIFLMPRGGISNTAP